MTRQRNVLTGDQRLQLLLWLESSRPLLARKMAKIHTAAILASKALGFKVTRANVNWMAEKHHLHWQAWQVTTRPKNSWRCPHCGGLMKKQKCSGCDLSRSLRRNEQIAKSHGLEWLTKLYKGGRDGSHDNREERPE